MTLKSIHGIEAEEFLNSIKETIRTEISRLQKGKSGSAESDFKGIDAAQNITKLSKSRIYQLVSKKQIPYFKKSGKLFFSEKELKHWIKTGKQSPTIKRKGVRCIVA